MKKLLLFIFTFIIGISAYADSYLYIDDFSIYRGQLGTEIVIPVKAHFDARLSTLEVYYNCPEGLTAVTVEAGADSFINYLDNTGNTCICNPTLFYNNNVIYAISSMTMGYWIPEGSTNYETYGAVKWEAGDYNEFFLLRFSVADNFNGGSITLETTCSSAYDTRGGTVNDNGDAQVPFTKVCNVSVIDNPVVEKTPSPNINYTVNTDDVTIAANGEGIVTLFVNGEEVNNPYVINRIFEDQTLSVFSYAQEIGKLISDTVYLTIIVPAKEGQPDKTDSPTISYSTTDDDVIITATGNGNVLLYIDGLIVDNPHSISRAETDFYVTATATAQEEGKLISEIASLRINVPANENPLDENDWNILKSFYNQYSNGHFTWDLSDAVIAKKCEGVTVENLRVVAIDLSSKSLEGDFPAMLLALDQLRTLDLSNNNLSGDAEYQIAEYVSGHSISTTALRRLLINDNEFVGNAGSLASYFNNLEVLRAGGNHFNQVQPMVNPDVELDLNNQSLDMDGNIINGIETLSSALPSICLYDHNRQTFMTTVNLELIDVTQNPEWKMNIYMGNGEFSISSNSAYRGSNGQHLDGHTYLQSSWNNEQKLNLLFTFAPGDANFKGNVDITDLQAIVNYIFGDNNNKPFNYTAANLNNDNIVNVQDVVGEVNMLLSTIPSTPRYYTRYVPDTDSIDDNAQLYWEQGVLYLRTNKPVAAIDIVNEVNGDIEWNVANIGMVVMTSMCEKGEHAIIYSLDNAAFQPGVTAIATTTATVQSIYAAKLSDTDAELVSVTLNTNPAELNDITIDSEVSCRLEGTCLVINNGKNLSEVDIDVYAIDGMLVANKHMPLLNSGANRVNLIDLIENNQLYIIVVRNGRHVIATQKITQIR